MKKFFPMYLRITVIFFSFFGLMEYFIDSGNQPAFIKYPITILVLAVFLAALLIVEYIFAALNGINYLLTPEEKRKELELEAELPLRQRQWYKNLMKRLTRTEPIENEALLMLDHNYDGIR